jgi:hypothetical protein
MESLFTDRSQALTQSQPAIHGCRSHSGQTGASGVKCRASAQDARAREKGGVLSGSTIGVHNIVIAAKISSARTYYLEFTTLSQLPRNRDFDG